MVYYLNNFNFLMIYSWFFKKWGNGLVSNYLIWFYIKAILIFYCLNLCKDIDLSRLNFKSIEDYFN